jgi:hypothetical protein
MNIDDRRTCAMAADGLLEPYEFMHLVKRRVKRRRKPNIGRMIAAAERGGKNVTSIITPDGVTLHFGKVEDTEASNPWLDDLKVTKQ